MKKLKMSDLSTPTGCKEYLNAILENIDENSDETALPFILALKAAVIFIDGFIVYRNKHGKLDLEDYITYKESL